ncbi:hypothetical protein [Thermomonospora cellulosilytica]|uniref:Orotate phosphoribosyltransferase-like protein n=1 Tax=Thermomonospora cellulosilytica TaxID=1411118 RepID=A0A7W3N1L0_9ACTN|nr:hypothetical protein [Thermomonospora cellulosilytica]MBA9005871.1 orotate phosphoribosyltransferase-like protein [Thermomonospora cellulosilytica]
MKQAAEAQQDYEEALRKLREERDAKWRALAEQGVLQGDIAKAADVSRETVRLALNPEARREQLERRLKTPRS